MANPFLQTQRYLLSSLPNTFCFAVDSIADIKRTTHNNSKRNGELLLMNSVKSFDTNHFETSGKEQEFSHSKESKSKSSAAPWQLKI